MKKRLGSKTSSGFLYLERPFFDVVRAFQGVGGWGYKQAFSSTSTATQLPARRKQTVRAW
jgi:hypothetical protein